MPSSSHETVVALTAASIVAGTVAYIYATRRTAKQLPGEEKAVAPPHVWSWIPYLGSAIAMGADVTRFIRGSAQKLNDAPVFTATILGDHCVFIAAPEYLSIVFRAKYTKFLDSLSLQKQFTETVLDCNPQEIQENFEETTNKVTGKQFHQYLFKGDELERSMEEVQTLFRKAVPQLATSTNGNNDSNTTSTSTSTSSWTSHSLFDMVVRTIFKATMGPIFGPTLVTDELYEEFRVFDKGVIPLFNRAPNMLTDRARKARAYIGQQIQSPGFVETCSPFMKARHQAYLKELNLSEGTLHKSNLGLFWASVGNSAPAIFWTLLLLLEHPEAWNACVAQVESIVAKRTSISSSNQEKTDVFSLEELDEMTLLQSAFTESLRLYQGNFTARKVVQAFVLETKDQKYRIPKGSKLMSWWGILHRDPHIFDRPDEFVFDRFVDKSRKDFSFADGRTLLHEPVMPFGGGEQLCPGRKFASYELRLYLAMLMQTFDMRLVQGETRPGIDPAMVGIGVCHPDKDIQVEIRPRVPN